MEPVRILVLLSLVGPAASGTAPPTDSSPAVGSAVTISLLPDSATFDIESVRRGAVGFTARIRNEGSAAVMIAHPNICFPADYVQGETRSREDSRGRSEILLRIERPDGEHVVLREGLLGFFEPGNFDHLVVRPGETGRFHLGWFFQNARGMWENDARAGSVFLEEGRYSVSILFRNAFPKAWIRNESTGRPRLVEAWTGEMESEDVTVTIEPGGE
jgi:hypothetical protein